MNVDYIDTASMYTHEFQAALPVDWQKEETLPAFENPKEKGIVGQCGITDFGTKKHQISDRPPLRVQWRVYLISAIIV